MSFRFVQTDHPSLIRLSDDCQEAVRCETGASASAAIVYMDQPLEVGNELVIYVDDALKTGQNAPSLLLGMTTCCVRKILKFDTHADSICRADGPCEGRSATIQLKRCSYKGARIFIKRVPDQRHITVFVGNYKGSMSGMNFRTIGRLFPFLVLTGDVTAVRIGSESVRQEYVSPYLVPQNESMLNGSGGDGASHSPDPVSGYAFLLPGRPDRHEPGKVRTFMRGSMHGVANKIVFLTQELLPDSPLNLKIIEVRNSERPFSFIFGVTTCDRTSFGTKYLHKFVYNDPSTCSGHSKFCKVPALATGEEVTIERAKDAFIQITMGATIYQMEDESSFFQGKKIFPFIMITGSAYAISIFGTTAFSPHRDRPAARRHSIHRPIAICNQSFFQQENPGGYEFMVNQENGSLVPRKVASSRTRGIRMRMTFLNKELAVGDPLLIRIVKKNVEQDISFTFGVTKCNRTDRDLPFDHVFNFQKPSTCKGHEVHCEIPSQHENVIVSFERTDMDFIQIHTEKSSFLLRDRTGIFKQCKAFPYVMVNGSAYTLEIMNQNEVPLHLHQVNGSHQKSSGNSSVIDSGNYCEGMLTPARNDWGDTDEEVEEQVDSHESEPPIESAPAPLSKVSTKKWYSNVIVAAKNSKLTRFGDANYHCAIMGDKFPAGDCIKFRVSQIDTQFTGSITFGVTTTPLVMIDLDEIPVDSDDKWLISSDILPVISCADEFCIQRTDTDVRLGSSTGDEGHEVVCLFPIPSGTKVCPFFRFDGSVRELLMTN